jgi:hypothetical protein
VTSGSGKLKMALCVCRRYCCFCVFFLVCLLLDVGLSYSGKQNLNYVVRVLFCYCKWRFGVACSQIMFLPMFTQECNNEWLMYVGKGVYDSEPNGFYLNKAFLSRLLGAAVSLRLITVCVLRRDSCFQNCLRSFR